MKKKMTTADVRQAVREAGRIADWDDSARAFDEWLADFAALIWDEGFDAGERDVMSHTTWDEPCIPNPYRKVK
jgi:hypothetical protein